MILHKYFSGTYILKEITQTINIEHLNMLINRVLKNRHELDESASVERAKRHGNFVIICGYASISKDTLGGLIEQFLFEYDINYEVKQLDESDIKTIKNVLPVLSARKNDQCGGITPDTPSMDPGVEPLCEAISLYNGINTFSSCEGHINNNSGTFYVLFTHDTKKDLDKFTLKLWEGLEKVYEKYPNIPEPHLMFDFGQWPHMKCTYFEIRIIYKESEQVLVFESMNYLAKILAENK